MREKQSGEPPVFSSLVHHVVDDAEGFASGNVPLIPPLTPLIRSESGWWLFLSRAAVFVRCSGTGFTAQQLRAELNMSLFLPHVRVIESSCPRTDSGSSGFHLL